jgi:EmrB/QacA subfamily drug resistance transporter
MTNLKISTLWTMLSALLVGTLIGTMGNSMVSIALPSFITFFNISLSSAVWSITLYTLTFSVLIPVFGALSPALGFKRMFISGMLIVNVCSVMCIYAPNYTLFLIARVGIGIGVATVLPTIMGIVTNFFPSEIQGRAIGIWALVNSLGHAIGPMLGGFLVNSFDWPAIFWANLPLGVISIVIAWRVFPKDKTIGTVKTFDWFGATGMTVLVFSAMLGITQISQYGLLAGRTVALFGIALAALTFILSYERKREKPFLNLELFTKKEYISAIAPISLQAFTQFGLLVSLPIFLIDIHAIEKQLAGGIIMSMTVMMAITSPIAGRLVDRWNSKVICLMGTLLVGAGSVFMFFMRTEELTPWGWALFLLNLAVFGTGFGMIQASATVAAIQASPKEISGAATGFFHMIRFVSASLGSTVIGIILETNRGGGTSGFYRTFLLTTILAALTIPVTFLMQPPAKKAEPAAVYPD